MDECIFCKIVAEELPCYRVYEDETFLGFLDIYPRVKGHSLLIPKDHHRWVYDVPNFGEYWSVAKRISEASIAAFEPEFVSFITHGLEVPHAHIHILPRQRGENVFVPDTIALAPEELETIRAKIVAHIR